MRFQTIFVSYLFNDKQMGMLKQNLQQKQLQKFSPQQLQFIKLLQIPTHMLDARIKEELEGNPVLEDASLGSVETETEYSLDEDQPYIKEESESTFEELNVNDYLQDDDTEIKEYYTPDDRSKRDLRLMEFPSFFENLEYQLNMLDLVDKDYVIALQLIGSLDDDGYLRRSISSLSNDLAFARNVDASEEEIEKMLKRIQSFEPLGIGARSLQECLLIQLQKKDSSAPAVRTALLIIQRYLDDFTKKHYEKLEKQLNISSVELKDAVNEILKLNPKPGDASTEGAFKQMQIIPDFIVTNNEGVLSLALNSKNAPELKISRFYQEMLGLYDKDSKKDRKAKEAILFIKQKLEAANWFIDAIKQRQQTLIKTMNAIIQYQYDYFLTGDERNLRPMILKDIADSIDMDISTVSRVANSKYVQTDFGTFLIKSFFSEGIQIDTGEEVSNKEVKKILKDCILSENKDKPLTDEKLLEILKAKGYPIARRTVAKYREQLGIPVARLRKEL